MRKGLCAGPMKVREQNGLGHKRHLNELLSVQPISLNLRHEKADFVNVSRLWYFEQAVTPNWKLLLQDGRHHAVGRRPLCSVAPK